MTELLAGVLELVQLAHDTQLPHEESESGGDGGTSTVLVLAGVAVALALVAGLVWVKKRVDVGEGERLEGP